MNPDLITLLPGHLSIIKVNAAQPGICGRDQQLAYGRVNLRVVDGFQHSHEKMVTDQIPLQKTALNLT